MIVRSSGVEQRTLESNFIALQTLHGLFEQALASGGEAGYVILFPFNRSVDMFENLLNRVGNFCTNSVSRDQCNLTRSWLVLVQNART